MTTTLAAPPVAAATRPVALSRVFAVFVLVYLSTWGGHYTSGDGAVKLAWTRAMLTGSADIDPGPGIAYSKYGAGHSLLAIVPIATARLVEAGTGVQCEALLYTLLFVLNGACFLTLVAAYLRRHFEASIVWRTLLVLGLCTIWWPYTKLDFSEPLVATGLFAGFLLIRSGRAASGLLVAGASGLVRPEAFAAVVLLFAWTTAVQRVRGWSAVGLAAAVAPAVVLHFLSNVWRYGSMSDGYAGESFSTPLLVGLWGLLLSPGKSIFLYSPPLLAAVAGMRRYAGRSRELKEDAILFVSLLIVQLLLYCRWWDWAGDDAWGVRFVIPGVMFSCVLVAASMDRRWIVGSAAAAGLIVQASAVLVSPLDYALMVRSGTGERQALYFDQRTPVDFEDLRFHPRYSPVAAHVRLVTVALGISGSQSDSSDAVRSGTALSDAFPPEEWARYGRWDPLWMRATACVVGSPASSLRECIRAR